MNAAKIVTRNSLVFWRAWRGSVILSVLFPVMFLSAMGLGVGTLIERQDAQAFGEAGYLGFFSTGMLAATCMMSGTFSATYPVMNKIRWQRNYEALLSTPLTVRDLFLGEVAWIGLMLGLQAVPFFAVMAAFGVPETPFATAAIPVAVLVGLCFAAPVMAFTATLETDGAYNWLFRFVITPLFLLSGTFFPASVLPGWAIPIANLTPLYHGLELVRGLVLYGIPAGGVIWHLGFLLVFLAVGSAIGIRTFTRKLVT